MSETIDENIEGTHTVQQGQHGLFQIRAIVKLTNINTEAKKTE